MLVASTYPIDVVAAQQWLASDVEGVSTGPLKKNSSLKGDALVKAAEQQPWDPSVQALVSIPDALKKLSENIQWTADLGDAFLAQQTEVMDAVQRLRAKAKEGGKLESTEQQKVETTTVESKTVIEIQPSNPEVVYVPSYSPTVIWGAPYYPYPPLYYPPYYGGAWLGFGVGIAIGIGISGGWGWGCGWGGNNNITINRNNNYINHYDRQNNVNRGNNNNWQHNPQQRGGAPYKDRATAQKYGGGTRGDPALGTPGEARQAQRIDRSRSVAAGAGSYDRAGGAEPGREPSILLAELERPFEQRVRRIVQREPGALVELARILEHEQHVARRRDVPRRWRRAAAVGKEPDMKTHDLSRWSLAAALAILALPAAALALSSRRHGEGAGARSPSTPRSRRPTPSSRRPRPATSRPCSRSSVPTARTSFPREIRSGTRATSPSSPRRRTRR